MTAIYDMYTFNTYTRYIKDQCDYANPNMIRQPFTEFIRGISRANMTAMYEMQTFNTYSRYIQPNVTAIYTSMSFYEVYPVQRDYANPSMSF